MNEEQALRETLNKLQVQLNGLEPTASPEVRRHIEESIEEVRVKLKTLERD